MVRFFAETVETDPKFTAPVYNVPRGINKEYYQRFFILTNFENTTSVQNYRAKKEHFSQN